MICYDPSQEKDFSSLISFEPSKTTQERLNLKTRGPRSIARAKKASKKEQEISSQPRQLAELEITDQLGGGRQAWGARKLGAWKRGSGQSKEWRCCPYARATGKHLAGVYFGRRRRAKRMREDRFVPGVPINALRKYTGIKLGYGIRPSDASPSSNAAAVRRVLQNELRSEDDCEASGNETTEQYLKPSQREELYSSDFSSIKSEVAGAKSHNCTIPYENFVGAMLGSSFRIVGLKRGENHGDVYLVEELNQSDDEYEAKAYLLRGIPKKLYDYRLRNLKKLAGKLSFVCSLNQNGRKFIVNRLPRTVPISTTPSAAKGPKLGAIGRRGSPEFQEAFPELPKPSLDPVSERSSSTRMSSLLDCIERTLKAGESQSLLTAEASELVRTALAASFASKVVDSLAMPEVEPTQPKAPRTWRQMESRRIRQHRSRRKKTAAIKADATVKDPEPTS